MKIGTILNIKLCAQAAQFLAPLCFFGGTARITEDDNSTTAP
jgi:hypothetical protein